MTIDKVERKRGCYETIALTGIERKEQVYVLFESVTDIIGDEELHHAECYPHWTFTSTGGVEWEVSLLDEYMHYSQIKGLASVVLSTIPYAEIESIGCELSIDISSLVGISIAMKNGVEIRLI